MNIREFRALTDVAFRAQGFVERRLVGQKVWSLPDAEVIRFFQPLAYRRPWGFLLSGILGIEIPELRTWLEQHKPNQESGIFQGCFVGYNIANDSVLGEFRSLIDTPVPADLWAGLVMDQLDQLPSRLDDLIDQYRRNREPLGWLAHPHDRFTWDFLLRWRQDPDPTLHVPRMSPTGQIV
ncbi:hypothetical protein MRBLMA1_001128 [Sphingobium sp. LMA1-1-1.1]|uniref:hypothetical protein n=1 Tax=unclassified Sphingobium TaxID=2611147 RepID=UPI00343B1138